MSGLRLLRAPGVLEQDLGDELLLYRGDDTAVHVLNPTGRAVWNLWDGRQSTAAVAEHLRATFALTEGKDVLADVERMVVELRECGLLVEA